MAKKCNGYYFICRYKGKPVCSLELTFRNEKTDILRLCAECAKNYVKQHPKDKEIVEQGILVNSAIGSFIKKEAGG